MTFDVGFAGSAGMRLSGALAFAVLACATVMVVEYGGRTATPLSAVISTSTVSGRLTLETTFPVARWTVQAQGRDLIATTVSAQHWEAPATGNGSTIYIQAEAADPLSIAPVALRWNYAGKSGIWWGEGSVAEKLTPDLPAAGKIMNQNAP